MDTEIVLDQTEVNKKCRKSRNNELLNF